MVVDSGSRRGPRSTHARPTDDELLDAAVTVFAERGYAATTMSAIAERSDSSKPTLYAHFADKEELYARVVEREADTCRTVLFEAYAASAGQDLQQQVYADNRALFDYAEAHPAGFVVLLGQDVTIAAVTTREQLLSSVTRNIAQRVRDYVDPGADDEPAETQYQVAAMLVGVALSAARHALSRGGSFDAACDLASWFSTAALTALSADPPSASSTGARADNPPTGG